MRLLIERPNLVPIGRVGRTYGHRGWVWLRCDSTVQIFKSKELWVKIQGGSSWVLKSIFQIKKRSASFILFFPDYCNKEMASALNGATLAVRRDTLEVPPLGTHYWCDLQGLKVVSSAGKSLGNIKSLIETGANDVLVLEGMRGGERLIPFIKEVILRVDLKKGLVIVDWDPEF